MRKMICILLVLCLSCFPVFLSAEEAPSSESPSGTWYLVRGEVSGVSVAIIADELSVIISLNRDGTFTARETWSGETEESAGTWETAAGGVTLTTDTGVRTCPIRDGEMIIAISDSVTLYLSRSVSGVTGFTVPAALAAETAEDFNGRWVISKTIVTGMVASADNVDENERSQIVIGNGRISESAVDENGRRTEVSAYDCEFRDGLLTGSVAADGVTVRMTFSLLEDGSLSCMAEYCRDTGGDTEIVARYQLIYRHMSAAAE